MPTPMKSMFNNLPSPFSAAAAAVVEEESSVASSTTMNNNGGSGGEEVWICSCAKQWPMTQKRCGNAQCCKWRDGKRDNVGHRSDASSSSTNKTKKQQQRVTTDNATTTNNTNDGGDWTCHNCQHTMAAKKQRCGKCSHWKGGKRTLFKKKTDDIATAATSSVASAATDTAVQKANSYPFDITQEWTCTNCSITLPGKQTRCGKCHAWRGGKRQGGWKLKFKSNEDEDDDDDGIDRTVDWTCCNVVLPARQTRCGKCHKWRGGKRVFAGKNGGGNESSKKKRRVKSESEKKTVKLVANDQLKDQVEVPGVPSVHSPALALANDSSSNDKGNIVFEYPMPSISTAAVAAAPMYHPLPSIAAESYCPLPSPIASCAALVTNSAETAEI